MTAIFCGVLLVLAASAACQYLATEFVSGGTVRSEQEKVLSILRDRWDLVAVKGPGDLLSVLGKARIAKIEFEPNTIQHAKEAPRQGLIVRVWSSNLLGRIGRDSFVFVSHDDGIARLSRLTSL